MCKHKERDVFVSVFVRGMSAGIQDYFGEDSNLGGAAVFLVVLTWGSLFALPKITLARFGEVRYTVMLLNYTSPTILAAAVCFLAL